MSNIFPRKLDRVRYFCYHLCLIIGIGILAGIFPPLIVNRDFYQDTNLVQPLLVSTSIALINILKAVVLGFKFLLLDIPRIRSIGWSPWMVLLMVIPLMQIFLFVVPADFFAKDNTLDDILKRAKSKPRR